MMTYIEEMLSYINDIDDTIMEYELEVTNALVDSYQKALTIMENYNGDSITDFSIFQEGFILEADENDKSNFTFRQTDADGNKESIVKSVLYAIPRLIKFLIDCIKKKMNKNSVEKLENNVTAINDMTDGEKEICDNAIANASTTVNTNSQERAARKAEKLEGYAANAEKRSNDYYQASKEGAAFLSLGEPIKIGHHSERRHRRLIERNWERMGKSVAESERAKDYERRAEYWADKANKIDLSMPESLSYFEFELEKAKKYHLLLKENPEKRAHSMSLQYANKAVRDMEEKVFLALRLWGDEEDIKQMQEQRQEKAQGKAAKSQKKQDIIERHHGFFSFNNEQFYEGYNKLKANGILNEGEKVVHVGMGLYIPKTQVESFLTEYKRG